MKLTDYCIEHYFHQPNYWRIDGRLVFAIYDPTLFLQTFPGDQLKRLFDKMRERVAKAGLGELHLQASHVYKGHEAQLAGLGFDSVTHYHTFGLAWGPWPLGVRIVYGEAARASIHLWKQTAAQPSIPYYPGCPVGADDNSPRVGPSGRMITQRTPDQYERRLRAAQYFSAASSTKPKVIFLSSWNEWTEDHMLLPDTVFGYSYLEAVRRVLRS